MTIFKNSYLNLVKALLLLVDNIIYILKQSEDKPTIGLLLCKNKKKLTVEYALRKNLNPIGVASYETKLVESLPKEFRSSLPTIKEIEAELEIRELASVKSVKKAKSTKSKKK